MSFLKKLKATFMEVFFEKKAKKKSSRLASKKKKRLTRKSVSKTKKAAAGKSKTPAKKVAKAAPKKPEKTVKVKTSGLKVQVPASAKKKAGPEPKTSKDIPAKAEKKEKLKGAKVGMVTHFFPQVNAAAIKVGAPGIQVGDVLEFKGATTHFRLKISSMQINRVPVTQASKGAEVGILVPKRVREGDEVFKV